MRMKPANPGVDVCVVSGCRVPSVIALTADTAIGREVTFKVSEDIGVCDPHWDKHCAEEAKLELGVGSRKRSPVQKRIKRTPVARRWG